MPKRITTTYNPEEYLKSWIRNHNPDVLAKRKTYALDPNLKKQRNINNQRRRTTCSSILSILKTKTLVDEDGNSYFVKNNRLIKKDEKKKKYVLRCNKRGDIFETAFTNEEELDNEKFDKPIIDKETKVATLYENLVKLFDGDKRLTDLLCKKKQLVDVVVPPDERYWENFDQDEKEAMLSKIRIKKDE